MRIILPYTAEKLHTRTVELMDTHLPGWVGYEILPQQTTAYFQLLADLWATPEDLLIVEHDMGPHADVLPQFEQCPNMWCGFEYLIDTCPVVALGCTRFRAELMHTHPDLFAVTGLIDDDGLPLAKDWRRVDCRLDAELRRRGHTPCKHLPRVDHFHDYT